MVLSEALRGIEYKVLMGTDEVCLDDVVYGSRKAVPNTVFVCQKGSRFDSHDVIDDIVQKGCNVFVVERDLDELKLPEGTELNILKVANTREALALLAAAHFSFPSQKMTMIGITGTKGKTTTSYMVKTVLEHAGKKVGIIGTNGCIIDGVHYETRNTTPDAYELNERFYQMVEAGCEYCVMECSSQGYKMHRLDGIHYDYAIFLNISPDHIGPDEHEDFADYLYCKTRLFANADCCILNRDDPHYDEILEISGRSDGRNVYSFSMKDEGADLMAYGLRYTADADFTGADFFVKGLFEDEIKLSIPGNFNVSNALPVLIASHLMKLDTDAVKAGLMDIHVDGRMEVVFRNDTFTILVDYAHNEVSMVSLLNTLREYNSKRLVVVFGCGGNRSKDRRTSMGKAAAESADFTIITEDNSRFEKVEDIIHDIEVSYFAAGGKAENMVEVPDRRAAIRYSMEHAQKGDMIAVIGKGHEDYQEINGVRTHFSDREEILKAKEELNL